MLSFCIIITSSNTTPYISNSCELKDQQHEILKSLLSQDRFDPITISQEQQFKQDFLSNMQKLMAGNSLAQQPNAQQTGLNFTS